MPKRRITRVTTRRGDKGETSLADGSSVAKTSDRIHTIGAVDELNSFVGLLVNRMQAAEGPDVLLAVLERLQQELFDIGAHLATSGATPVPALEWLEERVAELNDQLPPLTEFVIPGGSETAALAHVCRTVCRRAERHAWAVADADAVARYLNRLSDLFFVMARVQNAGIEPQWRGLAAPGDSKG
ncbi:MAG: cob(I)yrinic acid a,c-diamide adenosyltransferase [Pseudomonadales bacterium]